MMQPLHFVSDLDVSNLMGALASSMDRVVLQGTLRTLRASEQAALVRAEQLEAEVERLKALPDLAWYRDQLDKDRHETNRLRAALERIAVRLEDACSYTPTAFKVELIAIAREALR